MRLVVSMLFAASCGVGFQSNESTTGTSSTGSTTGGAATTGGAGTGSATGSGAFGGMGGVGGSGGMGGPYALTVCANDSDYNLDGVQMPGNDDKLENPATFGPGAPVEITFDVVLISNANLSSATLVAQGCDIVQLGLEEFEVGSGSGYTSVTSAQIDEVRAWSLTPGHVVIGAQGFAANWGNYVATSGVTNPMVAPAGGSPLFDGPYGDPSGFNQGGTFQGKWSTLVDGQFCELIEDSSGNVVGFSDRLTGDIFFADVDVISALGGASSGSNIRTNNDILFANLYAMAADYALAQVTDPCP